MKEESFLKKLIISIKDFEKYPDLASKKWQVVIPYLLKLLAVFTIIVSFASTYQVAKQIQNGLQYIKEEIPEFTFEDMKLKMNSESPIIKENMDNLFDTVIIDTEEIGEDTLNNYNETLQKSQNGIAIMQDKLLLKTSVTKGIIEYNYSSIVEEYKLQNFNKQGMLEYFSGTNIVLICSGIFIMLFIYMFLIYITSIWLDIILLASFGVITALFMRLHIRFSAMCKIAIHGLTLPILLNAVAILLDTFVGFKIEYFQIMYIGIAYIYIVTAILMIKSDVIKNQQELTKILEEQARVKQEMERQKEEEETKKEEEKREKEKEKQRKKEKQEEDKNVGEEPQGENA